MNIGTKYDPSPEPVLVTARPNIVPESGARKAGLGSRLAEALGVAAPQIEEMAKDLKKKKTLEQEHKLNTYTETISREFGSKPVSDAQVKERLPETVPIIRMRIAEAVGKRNGTQQFSQEIQTVLEDESLRLDEAKSEAFLKQARDKLVLGIGEGNDFYANGYVQAIDSQINQYRTNWALERAKHHNDLLEKDFGNHVANGINSASTQKGISDYLLSLDKTWKGSGSISNSRRNEIVKDTVIDIAFASGNSKILDAVPNRFRSAETNAEFEKTKQQILSGQMAQLRANKFLTDQARAKALRSAQLEIIGNASDGKPINPSRYRRNPEAFEFAVRLNGAPRVDETLSIANMQRKKRDILNFSTVGREQVTIDLLEKQVMSHPEMNPREVQALLSELPKLVEGRNLMNDPMIMKQYTLQLSPLFANYEKSYTSQIGGFLGINPRTEIMRQFQSDIQNYFTAYYEENGSFPTGFKKLELVEKAVERAAKSLTYYSSSKGLEEVAGRQTKAETTGGTSEAPKGKKKVPVEGMPGVYKYVDD